MASPSSTFLYLQPLLLLLLLLHPLSTLSQTCSTQTFTKNQLFTHCTDLPRLTSYLHWTYNPTNTSLSIAFIAPSKTNGWVSWAINPTATGMLGSQALIGYHKDDGSVQVDTYNITTYKVEASKIAFDVTNMEGEYVNGAIRIYATVLLGKNVGSVLNQVWQVGDSVKDGVPQKHAFQPDNLNSHGTIDLVNGGSTSAAAGGADSKLRKKNIHGILNVVSWGLLFPFGVIIARYMRTFKLADPAWFYIHVFCQCSAYAIGVTGWATGLKLGSESKGITHTNHRNIGIALFSLATLQVFALLLRPKKEHKIRFYWNIYHHGVGYVIVVLGILNVFKGLDILVPESRWRTTYIIVLAVLGGLALLLEAITWIIVLKRKSDKSTKPYDGPNCI